MSRHPTRPLTFRQTQTESNVNDRAAFRLPQFPAPHTPSQQFSIDRGKQILGFDEQRALDRIVNNMKRKRVQGMGRTTAGDFRGAFR